MNRLFFTAFFARVFSMVAALCAGLISLKLYKSYLTLEIYGVIVVAVQIMSYMPLVDGGFRTTVNRALLTETNPDRRAALVKFSQVFCSYLALIIFALSLAMMTAYRFSPNARYFDCAFSMETFKNMDSFAMKLNHPTNLVSAFLSSRLSDETCEALTNYQGGVVAKPLQRLLVENLNRIIKSESIYDGQRFAGIGLRPETAQLLSKRDLHGDSLMRLNRRLIEDAYPAEISPCRDFDSLVFFLTLAISGTVSLVVSIQGGLLLGLGAQTALFLANGVISLLTVATLALSLRFGAGAWAFPISTIAGFAGIYPIICIAIRRLHPNLKFFDFRMDAYFWPQFHKLKHDAMACLRSQIAVMFLFTIDLVVIGFLCPAKEAALYAVLSRLFAIVRNCLQTMAEVGWPLIAQKTHDTTRLTRLLPRINAWIYGGVMGSLCVTIGPFLKWYMGDKWTAPTLWIYLLSIRFVIVGASSPAGYFLLGMGEFKTLSRVIGRELAVAAILATTLGYWYHTTGIAAGFLIATASGAFLPLYWAYAKAAKLSVRNVVFACWSRAAVAFAASYLIAVSLLESLGYGLRIVPIGVGAACVPIAVAFLPSGLRVLRGRFGFGLDKRSSAADT